MNFIPNPLDMTNNALADKGAPVRRRAFTVIELLIVIGIITVLISMLFVAYTKVINSRHVSDTKTMLQTASTLLSNYEQATHFNRPLPDLSGATVTWTPAGLPVSAWNAPSATAYNLPIYWNQGLEPLPVAAATPPLPEVAPYAISTDFLIGTVQGKNYPNVSPASGLPQELVDTICVMYALQSIPDNAAIISNIPTQSKLSLQMNLGGGTTTVNLLLDAWGNPILFAPGFGVSGIATHLDDSYSMSATYNQGDLVSYNHQFYTWISPTPGNTAPTPGTNIGTLWGGICAPSLRPFWLSAGPDGDVSNRHGDYSASPTTAKDDDNIYSFNN